MSKRVEEKAIDAWAIYEYREHPKGLYHTCFVDGYKEGYEQAEKDLALTADDIKEIDEWISVIQTYDNLTGKELYKEVLRRFNSYRDAKK